MEAILKGQPQCGVSNGRLIEMDLQTSPRVTLQGTTVIWMYTFWCVCVRPLLCLGELSRGPLDADHLYARQTLGRL